MRMQLTKQITRKSDFLATKIAGQKQLMKTFELSADNARKLQQVLDMPWLPSGAIVTMNQINNWISGRGVKNFGGGIMYITFEDVHRHTLVFDAKTGKRFVTTTEKMMQRFKNRAGVEFAGHR